MTDSRRKAQRKGPFDGSTAHPGPHLFQEIVRSHQAMIAVFSQEVGMSAARTFSSRRSVCRIFDQYHSEEYTPPENRVKSSNRPERARLLISSASFTPV